MVRNKWRFFFLFSGSVSLQDAYFVYATNGVVVVIFRQFLFREADIGSAKSSTAAAAVSAMNPSLNIKPYEAKCAQETEELFSDDFYSGLSVS